jgi:hypothetical protein
MTPKPFTVTALAERWECSPDFIYDQIRAGRFCWVSGADDWL